MYLDAVRVDDLIANPTNIIAYRDEGSCAVDVRNTDSYSEALRLTQQMQGQAKCAAGADSRKGAYGFYGLLKGL